MSKSKNKGFVCSQCGFKSVKWLGRCPECGQWDVFVPDYEEEEQVRKNSIKPLSLDQIKVDEFFRIKFLDKNLNRIFGGGLVKGSVVLLAGNPGAGKSTLALKMIDLLPDELKVLYFSSEESFQQVKLRASRVLKKKNFEILSSNIFEDLVLSSQKEYDLLIIDSIQMLTSEKIPSVAGSLNLVRYIMGEIINFAKKRGITVIVIGHITKDGSVAGPKTLEHLVDVILYLDSLDGVNLRLLKSYKNRFGSTDEITIFRMEEDGLSPLDNIDSINLTKTDKVGRVISCTVEGTMPLAIEIESLIFYSKYGIPQRVPTGINIRRMQMLVGICEKYLGLNFGNMDIFINVSNGLNIKDTQIDLPVIVSMLSSFKNKLITKDLAFIGEVGLTGDLRSSNNIQLKIKHLETLGIKKVFIPYVENIRSGIEVHMMRNIKELKEIL